MKVWVSSNLAQLRPQVKRRHLTHIQTDGLIRQGIVDVVPEEQTILVRQVVIDPERSAVLAQGRWQSRGIIDKIRPTGGISRVRWCPELNRKLVPEWRYRPLAEEPSGLIQAASPAQIAIVT